jgi:glycosyltransferase involved in cell wall biosynthesis
MKLGVDAREIQDGVVTGIGRSLANFINYFEKNEKNHKLVLFSEKKISLDYDKNIIKAVINRIAPPFWDQWKLPRALDAHKIDLFYSPYYKIPLLTRTPVVNQILDLMFLVFQPYRKGLGFHRKLYYSFLGKTFAKKSISVITDSEHAKKDIIRIWNINPEKIVVIPLGLASRYKPITDLQQLNTVKKVFKLPDKFVLYLGNFKPHKNVASLIKAFKRIEKTYPEHKLILAGPLDNDGNTIKNLVLLEGLESRVLFTNTIKEKDHPEALLSLADVFVFPTLYEGFGLPPLEAMACGTSVVASNLTSIPEVIGDAGLLVNPMDIGEMSKTISDLLENPEKRMFYSKKGLKRAERFREKDTAGKLYEHIISLLEEKNENINYRRRWFYRRK